MQESVKEVAARFGVGEDKVQELQDRAAGFAAKVAAFCERTGLASLEMLIAKFQVDPSQMCESLLKRSEFTPQLGMAVSHTARKKYVTHTFSMIWKG